MSLPQLELGGTSGRPRAVDTLDVGVALWFVPAFLLALFMVHSMMEFVASLLTEHPPDSRRRESVDSAEIMRQLLALNTPDRDYRVIQNGDGSLSLHWDAVDPVWAARFPRVRLTQIYRARLLPDGDRSELRYYEMIRSGHIFFGFSGRRPIIAPSVSFFAGPMELVWSGNAYGLTADFPARVVDVRSFSVDTRVAKNDVRGVLRQAGWSLRPVFWPFQATGRGDRLRHALVPAVFRRMPGTRFWGVLYPASFLATIVWIVVSVGPAQLEIRDWGIVLLVSAVWFATSGFLTWLVLGTPGLRGRRPRRSGG